MASPHFTAEDVSRAAREIQWDEVERMIRGQPQLVNERDNLFGVTSLYRIVWGASRDLISVSLKVATSEAVDYVYPTFGDSILHWLALRGFSEELGIALNKSRNNVNLQNSVGDTPLHKLLRESHLIQVHQDGTQTLLHAGADLSLVNQQGQTPADVYMRNNCLDYDAASRAEQKDYLMKILHTGIVPVEILARGPEALKAFNDALSEGETEVNQGRTVFVGLEGVGKTSTINSFLKNPFNPHQDITDAIANTMVCTHDLQDELSWTETHNQHDTFEDKIVDSITNQLFEKENQEKGEVTQVKDVLLSAIRKDEAEYRQGQSSSEATTDPETESDVKRRRTNPQTLSIKDVPENIASKVQEKMNAIKFTRGGTSDEQKSGNNFIMNIWDFGGQPIYHVIQRIFMVSFAVVCVVFNLEDDLDAPAYVRDPTTGKMYEHRMTNLQFVLYWIRSVYTHRRDSKLNDGQLSPSVILIGTHLGSLEGNYQEKKIKAEEIFRKIRQAIEGKPYEAMVLPTLFAIENSLPFARSNASNIMNQILKFSKNMVRKLPLKWLLVQQEIQKLKERIYLPNEEVTTLADRCGVKQDAQRVMLEYLHDIGEILYYPDDEALNDIIVIDLMRTVDMFKTIITVVDPNLREPALRAAWRKLDSGILQERLLRHLWKKFNFSDKTFDFFISLMQKFGLVCERKMAMGDERIFYVLSRLKPERVDTLPTEDFGERAISIFHDFGRYLPDDLFQRGVTKFIEKFQVDGHEPKLSYEHVEMNIDELHHVVLNVAYIKHRRMFQTKIIRLKILNPVMHVENAEPSPSVCKEVLRFLETEFKMFCQSGLRELTRYIRCECNNAHMHVVRKFDKDGLPCGSNGMEVTRYRRLFEDVPHQQDFSQSQRAVPKPKGFVDDAIIQTVSEEMDRSWRRFGIRLGLSWSEVNNYANERRTYKSVENMLKHWRSSIYSEQHQLKVLCTALRQHGSKFWNLAGSLSVGAICQETEQAECFDNEDLLLICDNLGSGWRRLGLRLGLKWSDIKNIADNKKQVEDCIMEVLVTWKNGQPTNQIPIMINALREQKRVGLAECVRERHGYCKDELEVTTTQRSPHQAAKHHVEGSLEDVDMLFVAERLGKNWKTFGISIGLEYHDIEQIEMDFPPPPITNAILEMLITWREMQKGGVNHLVKICDVLNRHERADITEKLQTYYKEKYH